MKLQRDAPDQNVCRTYIYMLKLVRTETNLKYMYARAVHNAYIS